MANEIKAFGRDPALTYYFYVVDADGLYWDETHDVFEALNSASWSDYAEGTGTPNAVGDWFKDFPTSITAAGTYTITARRRAGDSPAVSDPVVAGPNDIVWDGTAEVVVGPGYTGRYTSETAVEQYIGTLNLDVYGDVDNDGTRDPGAVQQAIVSAEARVDYYRSGPFDVTDTSTVGAQLLELWSRKLAAVEVARKRLGKPVDELDDIETAVIAEMREGLDLPGVTEDPTDSSSLEKLLALTPARGKLNCPTLPCVPCLPFRYDTGCN